MNGIGIHIAGGIVTNSTTDIPSGQTFEDRVKAVVTEAYVKDIMKGVGVSITGSVIIGKDGGTVNGSSFSGTIN